MSTGLTRLPWLLTFSLVLALIALAACGDDGDAADGEGLVVTDAWSRPAVLLDGADEGMDEHDHGTAEEDAMDHDMGTDGTNGVVYMTIENDGEQDDRLVSATTVVSSSVELHAVSMADGVMQMRQVEGGIEVPAGETTVLEPGGLHVMLVGLHRTLEAGDRFDVELEFESAGSMTVEVEVREP